MLQTAKAGPREADCCSLAVVHGPQTIEVECGPLEAVLEMTVATALPVEAEPHDANAFLLAVSAGEIRKQSRPAEQFMPKPRVGLPRGVPAKPRLARPETIQRLAVSAVEGADEAEDKSAGACFVAGGQAGSWTCS